MAAGEASTELSQRQIARLSSRISVCDVETLAEGYMGMTAETLRDLRVRHDIETNGASYNREIFRCWAKENPGDQIKVRRVAFRMGCRP